MPKAGREIIPSTAAGADGRAGAWQGPDRGMRCIYPPRSKENGSGKADRKPGRMSNWTFGPGVDRAVLYRHCTGIAGFCDQNADHAGIYHFQRFDPGLCLGAEPYAEPTYLWFFGEKAEAAQRWGHCAVYSDLGGDPVCQMGAEETCIVLGQCLDSHCGDSGTVSHCLGNKEKNGHKKTAIWPFFAFQINI